MLNKMFFKQVKLGPMQNFSYVIGDEKSKDACIVDAGWEIDKLIDIVNKEKLKIKKIILTHSHFDHVQKVDELSSKTNAIVYFHESEYNQINPLIKNKTIKIIKLKNNRVINLGEIKIKVIHTPGHTNGSICLLIKNRLLTGDTLFVNAIGRTDLAGGDPIKLFESLQRLKKLSEDVEVYPGHDYGETPFSTIGNEKRNNPYFKCNTREQFLNLLGNINS